MTVLDSYEIFYYFVVSSFLFFTFLANTIDVSVSVKKLVHRSEKKYPLVIFLTLRAIPLAISALPFFNLLVRGITLVFCITPVFITIFIKIRLRTIKVQLPPLPYLHKGKLFLGTVKSSILTKRFYLPERDLQRHMFITGLTGMGKSNLVKHLLCQISEKYPSIPFLLVEFKGEYKDIVSQLGHVDVYRPGESLKINIFNPLGENPKIHAEKIMNMLSSCQIITFQDEFSSQMEKIFVEILYSVCLDKNRRNWDGFEHYLEVYKQKNQSKYYNLNNTLCSIENRIRRIKTGPLRSIFDEELNLNLHNLIKTNVIIDLSSIIQKGGTKNDAVFFSNMLFNHIWLRNLKKGPSSEINHFTLIEDSQFLLSQKASNKTVTSSHLEDFALLLRGTGECLITINTRPTISEDVMANAGVIISFQLNFDQNLMGKLLGLGEKKKFYLTHLDIGECIIKTNSVPAPFMLKVPLVN